MQTINCKPFTQAKVPARGRARPVVVCSSHRRVLPEAAVVGALVLATAPVAQALVEPLVSLGSADIIEAAGGGAAVVGLAGLLVATDPQNRRSKQLEETGGDEKEAVKKYFNTAGFERWRKIYGETDEVNKVQLDIRNGHAQTVEKVLTWIGDSVNGVTVADCGCGTGSLAIPLALRGACVSASDISDAMAMEAKARYEQAVKQPGATAPSVPPKFEALDLESVSGKYHTVTCLDVMIHYPQDRVDAMINHLASLSSNRLVISFAPKTLAYSVLKRIGELFPGPSKATRAYLHAEDDVEAALKRAGFKVVRKEMTATSFYFSRLFEAVRE